METLHKMVHDSKATSGAIGDIEATGGKGNASRSGYAKDKYPHLVEGEEAAGMATPIAGDRGSQEGRVPASQRKTGHYEACTAAEAESRASARRNGNLEPIEDGLDQPGRMKINVPEQYDEPRMEIGDASQLAPATIGAPTNAVPGVPNTPGVPVTPMIQQDNPQVVQLLQQLVQANAKTAAPVVTAPPTPGDNLHDYLRVDQRVQLSVPGGTYMLPAIDVKITPLGVIILLPLDDQHANFIPEPGTKIGVSFGGKTLSCYFPGTAFELEELHITVLALLQRADEVEDIDED